MSRNITEGAYCAASDTPRSASTALICWSSSSSQSTFQGAVLRVHKEPPRQLVHAPPNSTIVGLASPYLPALSADHDQKSPQLEHDYNELDGRNTFIGGSDDIDENFCSHSGGLNWPKWVLIE
jgi:hypothetical protein